MGSLRDKLDSIQPRKWASKWDHLTPAQRKEFEAIRKDYQAGKLKQPKYTIARVLAKEMGVVVSTVALWLDAHD